MNYFPGDLKVHLEVCQVLESSGLWREKVKLLKNVFIDEMATHTAEEATGRAWLGRKSRKGVKAERSPGEEEPLRVAAVA